jgi:tetratricopeptide (TPR) repeat protein
MSAAPLKGHPAGDTARDLISAWRLGEAESVLHRALRQDPNHPDLLCELCLVYCYSGREAHAVKLLDRALAGVRGGKLGSILAEHLQSRKLMDLKLGRKDPRLDEMLVKVRKVVRQDLSHVGVRLAACLIVRDEEKNLPHCLASLDGLVDEIVVVDTGSSDGTLIVAQEWGATIGNFEWDDHFAHARNHALSLCTAEWVLWIDADERLTPDSVDAVRRAIVRPQFGGYLVEIVNFTGDADEASQFVHSHVRLFRRLSGVCFEGRIHEGVTASIEALGLPTATLDGARMLHDGYRPQVLEARNKIDRSLEMLQKEVQENPQDPFHWFNLANALTVGRRWAEAEQAARMCARLAESDRPFARLNWQLLAHALVQSGRPDGALEACAEADAAGCGGLMVEYERANAWIRMGRLEEALEANDRCMRESGHPGEPLDRGILTHKRQLQRGQILALLGRFEDALAHLDEALSVSPDHPEGLFVKASTLEKLSRWEEALDLFGRCARDPDLASLGIKGAARVLVAQGEFSQAADRFEQAWRSDPEDHDAWIGWAQASEGTGDARQVAAAYEAFAAVHEPSGELLINWGRALDAMGETDRALHCFTEAIRRDSKNPNAYFNCGDLLYRLGQYHDAAHLYESGLRHQPLNAQGWFVLGNALARLQLVDAAKMSYEQALLHNPRLAEARHNLQLLEEGLAGREAA